MGVAGCGKSTVGALLAREQSASFLDGDDFHPADNVERMAAGIALTDVHRADWLEAIAARLALGRARGERIVLACSALKRSYRDTLRCSTPDLTRAWPVRPTCWPNAWPRGKATTCRPRCCRAAVRQAPTLDEVALTLDITVRPIRWRTPSPATWSRPWQPTTFTQVILETGADGRAGWREQTIHSEQADGPPVA
jgi:hypothetical protein